MGETPAKLVTSLTRDARTPVKAQIGRCHSRNASVRFQRSEKRVASSFDARVSRDAPLGPRYFYFYFRPDPDDTLGVPSRRSRLEISPLSINRLVAAPSASSNSASKIFQTNVAFYFSLSRTVIPAAKFSREHTRGYSAVFSLSPFARGVLAERAPSSSTAAGIIFVAS